ncbi:hypothetical protein [Bradyrhizobium sp.]|jgi:hypothetical protein|uniref:hypothetical protein n=1 Tax=Bradyrhizobium sp. TaxID=376 RepID=UPI003C19EBC0
MRIVRPSVSTESAARSIFLAWNRKPFDEAGNLDSNNQVALNGNVWWISAEGGAESYKTGGVQQIQHLSRFPEGQD